MSSESVDKKLARTPSDPDPAPLTRQVFAAIRGIRFGSVEIVVHEGKVVQIQRTEKFRIDSDR